MNDEGKIRIKTGGWLIPQSHLPSKNPSPIKIGELILIGGRMAIILNTKEDTIYLKKMVKFRWIGEENNYWINYNTFTELYGGKINE
jgi:hypothetical protein